MLTTVMLTRTLGASLSVLFVQQPTHSPAASDASSPETRAGVDPDREAAWQRAEDLYQRGSTLFEASDYLRAIDAFTEALELVGRHEFDPGVRRALLINLARVHRRAYLIDDKIVHLTMAADIYRRIAATAPGSEDADEAMRELPGLEAQIADVRARKGPTGQATQSRDPQRAQPAPSRGEAQGAEHAAQGPSEPAPRPTSDALNKDAPLRRADVLAGVMYGVAGLGVGAAISGILLGRSGESEGARLVAENPNRPRSDLDSAVARVRAGNGLTYGGAALALAGLTTGIVATIMHRRTKADASPPRTLRVGAAITPTAFGLSLSGRFNALP